VRSAPLEPCVLLRVFTSRIPLSFPHRSLLSPAHSTTSTTCTTPSLRRWLREDTREAYPELTTPEAMAAFVPGQECLVMVEPKTITTATSVD